MCLSWISWNETEAPYITKASGKTSFVNVIASGQVCPFPLSYLLYPRQSTLTQWSEDVVPTIAFNYRKVRKNAVTLKIWDVAGQPKFRSMWERYCNGVDAVVYVVLLSVGLHLYHHPIGSWLTRLT